MKLSEIILFTLYGLAFGVIIIFVNGLFHKQSPSTVVIYDETPVSSEYNWFPWAGGAYNYWPQWTGLYNGGGSGGYGYYGRGYGGGRHWGGSRPWGGGGHGAHGGGGAPRGGGGFGGGRAGGGGGGRR